MDLKLLGLSEYEQKAYKALVKVGKATASQISRESGVSYGKIYEVLASLEAKGLVRVIPEKTKLFVASDPEVLTKLAETKAKEIEQLKKDIQQLKQVYELKEEEVVEMVKGKRNFYKLIRKMKTPQEFKYTIKYTSEYQPEWVRQDRELIKKGVDVKSLTRYDSETKENVQKWLKIQPNIRTFENKGIAIDIRDSEVILTLIKNNVILSIKNGALIDAMKRMFLKSYESAGKIA